MKLLLVLCSFFITSITNDFQIDDDYYPEEVTLCEVGPYHFQQTFHSITLWYQGNLLIEFPKGIIPEAIFENNQLLCSMCFDGKLFLYQYDQGTLSNTAVFEEGFYQSSHIVSYEDSIYLYGGVIHYQGDEPIIQSSSLGQIDAYLITLNRTLVSIQVILIGGSGDEWFTHLKVTPTCFYLGGYKETLTGGDLGNAGGEEGASFVIQLSFEGKIMRRIFIEDPTIASVKIRDQVIILLTKTCVYHLSQELEVITALKFDLECRFTTLMSNLVVLRITATEMIFYSTDSMSEVARFPIILEMGVLTHHSNRLIVENEKGFYEYKIFDCRSFKKNTTYQERLNQVIYGLDLILLPQDTYFMTPYQATVWGDYPVMYDFHDTNIEGLITVDFYTNIHEGRYYPLGYQLLFTGNATLDGESIVNHHMVRTTGMHELVLTSIDGRVRIFTFFVERDQVNGQDHYHEVVDFEASVQEPFYLPLDIIVDTSIVIEDIMMNDQSVPFVVDNEHVAIECYEEEAGYYEYSIQYVVLCRGNLTWKEKPLVTFNVIVRDSSFPVETQFSIDYDFIHCKINLQDDKCQLRGILFTLESNDGIKTILFPTKSQSFVLSNLKANQLIKGRASLAYDDGSNRLGEIVLVEFTFIPPASIYQLGEMMIQQRGMSLEKMVVSFVKNKALQEVHITNLSIYQHQSINYGWYLGIGAGAGIVSFLGIMTIKRKYPKAFKKKKRIERRK
ncbi:MAG: hypothetical protein PHY42_03320 [Bacilli bacterium]|nr:hypothetical protein [Bacilli bacterium]